MTVLQTMWDTAVIIRIRARRVFVLGTVLVNLSVVALPSALAVDPDRRISQYGHTVWRIQDSAISPPTNIAQNTDRFHLADPCDGVSLGRLRRCSLSTPFANIEGWLTAPAHL